MKVKEREREREKKKKREREREKNLKRVMVRDGICVSNSFYVVFYPILAPIPNFIQSGS